MSGKHGLEMTEGAQWGGGSLLLGLLEGMEVVGGCGERRSVGSWSGAEGIFQINFFQRDAVSLARRESGEGTGRKKNTLSHA